MSINYMIEQYVRKDLRPLELLFVEQKPERIVEYYQTLLVNETKYWRIE